jgi:hypothetical protein
VKQRKQTFVSGLEARFLSSVKTHAKFNLGDRTASEVSACGGRSAWLVGGRRGIPSPSNNISLVVDRRNIDELLHTKLGG